MKPEYDILIIGSGLGGLECAYILSKKGYKVCMIEKNKNIGGTLQDFKLGESTFSSGMHYLGSLDEGQQLNKLFRYFNILDGLKLKKMDEAAFDRFNIGGRIIDYPMGWENFREKMTSYFPEEKETIKQYVKLIRGVVAKQDIYNLKPFEYKDIRTNEALQSGIYPFISSLTKNVDLQNALCALNFVYAGDKKTSPLYAHALINNYYIQSAYRLVGGSSQIANLLAANIEAQGGEVICKAQASEFVFEGNQLVGVNTADGQEFRAKHFISNIYPALTMDMIPEGKIRKSFRGRLASIEKTTAVFGLHMRLKPNQIPYLNCNYHFYEDKDVWPVTNYKKQSWPGFFYLYTPAQTASQKFADSMSIYAYMQFEEVKQWAGLPLNNRGTDYEDWKKEKAEKLIESATTVFPNLKENVLDWIAATPLTYRDYIGTPEGAMYGSLRDYTNPLGSLISAKSKIPNLFFTGQNINFHGMMGVSMSALVTCSEFIDINQMIKEINES